MVVLLAAASLSASQALFEADADLLARVARSEDPSAAAAVMWTVLNRAARSGTSVLEEAREDRYLGLASPWTGAPLLPSEVDLARRVLRGEVRDPTGGRTHFHLMGIESPPWAPDERDCVLVGAHLFYREVGAARGPRPVPRIVPADDPTPPPPSAERLVPEDPVPLVGPLSAAEFGTCFAAVEALLRFLFSFLGES